MIAEKENKGRFRQEKMIVDPALAGNESNNIKKVSQEQT
jgi:hypothetical protein